MWGVKSCYWELILEMDRVESYVAFGYLLVITQMPSQPVSQNLALSFLIE